MLMIVHSLVRLVVRILEKTWRVAPFGMPGSECLLLTTHCWTSQWWHPVDQASV